MSKRGPFLWTSFFNEQRPSWPNWNTISNLKQHTNNVFNHTKWWEKESHVFMQSSLWNGGLCLHFLFEKVNFWPTTTILLACGKYLGFYQYLWSTNVVLGSLILLWKFLYSGAFLSISPPPFMLFDIWFGSFLSLTYYFFSQWCESMCAPIWLSLLEINVWNSLSNLHWTWKGF